MKGKHIKESVTLITFLQAFPRELQEGFPVSKVIDILFTKLSKMLIVSAFN